MYERFLGREQPAGAQTAMGWQACVAVDPKEAVREQCKPQDAPALQAVAVERHKARKRFYEFSEMPHQPALLAQGGAVPLQIARLQIAQSAMHDPQAVPTGLTTKVLALNHNRLQPASGGLQQRRRALNPPSDDGNVPHDPTGPGK